MTITGSPFDALLAALDADREAAARKYEDVRKGLMRVFRLWGSDVPEHDADVTIDRVAGKLAGGERIRHENPFVYFHGVARFVFKEQARARQKERALAAEPVAEEAVVDEVGERRAACLDRCLAAMAPEAHRNLLDYYDLQERARIDRRRQIADRLGVSATALRLRMQRERDRLRECVLNCMRSKTLAFDTSR